MAADRWPRTVPFERCSRATAATVAPSAAATRTSRSRSVSGLVPLESDSAARVGSTTRNPARTRRTASTSCSGGASFTTNPDAFELLHRDVANVGDWFSRRGVAVDVEALYAELVGIAWTG